MRLTERDHDRTRPGRTYVYAVLSRRARGVSVGINLNPNNACNGRCVYCQVPGLVRAKAPAIDLALLERELGEVLDEVARPQFFDADVPEASRRLADVALAGNGEPTMSAQIEPAVEIAGRLLAARGLAGRVGLVLITNGSLVRRPGVARALARLSALGGEAWFKLDGATDAFLERENGAAVGVAEHLANLRACAALVPTWIQTLAYARGGAAPGPEWERAYLGALMDLARERVPLRGVRLYGLARDSHQPEAPELSRLEPAWLDALAAKIRALGFEVQVSP